MKPRLAFYLSLSGSTAVLAACSPRQSYRVEALSGEQRLITVSGACFDKNLDRYLDSVAKNACRNRVEAVENKAWKSHMTGNFLGECDVPQLSAIVTCARATK